jgi:hypothetical protein
LNGIGIGSRRLEDRNPMKPVAESEKKKQTSEVILIVGSVRLKA